MDILFGHYHDDVIKWKHFPHYWPFVRGIHQSLGNSPHKGQWRRTLIFSLICAWTNRWANNRDTGDLKYHWGHVHYVTVMYFQVRIFLCKFTLFINNVSHTKFILIWLIDKDFKQIFHLYCQHSVLWWPSTMGARAPSQYKDRLSQVWGFPC